MSLNLASLVAITSVFGLGMTMALLGSVKLRLTEKIGIDDAQFGTLFSVYNFSNLIFVLIAGLMRDTLGFQTIAIVGYIAGAISFFIFGNAKNYGAAIVACLLLGIGGMFLNTAGNVLLGDPSILFEDAPQSNNLGNVFFGVGAFFTPMLINFLCKKMNLSGAMNVLAIIIVLPLIFALTAEFPPAQQGFSFGDAATLLGQSQVIFCALTLLCYIALEVSMGGWITTYMTHVGADESKASQALSCFWIFIMIGRLLTALVIGEYFFNIGIHGAWYILGLAIVASIVLFMMTKINSIGWAFTSVIIIGLVFAPIFPTTVGLLFNRTDQAFWGTGFSLIFAIGLLGAIFVPAWMGAISRGKTIKASMAVAGGTAVILCIIALLMGFMLPEPIL